MNTDTVERDVEARAKEILKEEVLAFRAQWLNVYSPAQVNTLIDERMVEWRADALKQAQRERHEPFRFKPSPPARSTRPITYAEAQEVERLVETWSNEYRRENFDLFGGSHDAIEGALAANVSDWRGVALDQVRQAGKPRIASDKHVKADDLQWRIAALQRDLALFRKFHGPAPELDAQILTWLKAVTAEK